ncbi:hypothetical protein ECBD561099_5248 [Escherichia coli Bd5610_99]|nr:hypothetical protein ECBD561099_5248 [Escherichia coli Bd5610_99]
MTNFTTSTPHDALFKSFLMHPDTARDFMEIHLPKDLRELCDLDSLKLESASFVDEKLRALHSDILWSVKTREGDGYIYVVIEHQSREDIHMAFRLMRYSMAVMQRHIEHDKRRPLPLVIPMLFYHGSRSPYPWSLCWLDEFADPTTARKLYNAAFPLVDITVVPDDEIVQHRRVALLELIQKHIRQRDLMGLIDQLNRPGFPGECFICELRLPDHRFRWKHNKLFLLLPEEYGPAFPAIVDCYTSPPTLVWPVPLLHGFSSSYGVLPPLCKDH